MNNLVFSCGSVQILYNAFSPVRPLQQNLRRPFSFSFSFSEHRRLPMAERVRNKYSICAAPQATTLCLFPQNSPHSGIYRSARGMDEVKKEIVRRTIPFYLHFYYPFLH